MASSYTPLSKQGDLFMQLIMIWKELKKKEKINYNVLWLNYDQLHMKSSCTMALNPYAVKNESMKCIIISKTDHKKWTSNFSFTNILIEFTPSLIHFSWLNSALQRTATLLPFSAHWKSSLLFCKKKKGKVLKGSCHDCKRFRFLPWKKDFGHYFENIQEIKE